MADSFRNNSNDSAVFNRGTRKYGAIVSVEVSAADILSGGDVVPIIELPAEAIVTSIKVMNDTLDSGTDALFDIGIWKQTKLGTDVGNNSDGDGMQIVDDAAFEALDQDIYVDGSQEFNTANAILTELLGTGDTAAAAGTNTVDAADMFKGVRELGGITLGEDPAGYFLGMKATVGAVSGATAGTVLFLVEWLQG